MLINFVSSANNFLNHNLDDLFENYQKLTLYIS